MFRLKQLFCTSSPKKKKKATSHSNQFSINLRKYSEDILNHDVNVGIHETKCSSSNGEEMRQNFPCDVCWERNNDKCVAIIRCDTCRLNMCESCYCSYHQGTNALAIHPVTSLTQIRNIFCSKHRKRYLNFACMTCCTKVCALCIMKSHIGHQVTTDSDDLSPQTRSIATEDEKENLTMNIENQVGLRNSTEPMKVIVNRLQTHRLDFATDNTNETVVISDDSHTQTTLYDNNKRARCSENSIMCSREQSGVLKTQQERTSLSIYDWQSKREPILAEQPTIFYGTKGLPRSQRAMEGGLLPLMVNFFQPHIADNWQGGHIRINSENI